MVPGGHEATHLPPSQMPEAHADPAVQSPPVDVLQTPAMRVVSTHVQALPVQVEPTGLSHEQAAASTVAVVDPDGQGVQEEP